MSSLRERAVSAPRRLAQATQFYARERPATVGFMVAAALVRLVFWLATDRVWEDSLITITHARNAAHGLGLVHHLGEGRVHGFTSALSVLIPLVGELIADGGGIVILRLASIVASVVAIHFADEIGRRLQVGLGPSLFVFAYLAFERNQIFYGMAGMETEVAVAVLLGSVLALLDKRTIAGGVGLGLSLLARPDFILWCAPALVAVALEDRRRAAKTLGVALLVVAPWLIFTTAYYGSPVPHTILAKAGISPAIPTFSLSNVPAWSHWAEGRLVYHRYDWAGFAPFLSDGFLSRAPLPVWLLETIAFVFLALGLLGLATTLRRGWPWRAVLVYVAAFSAYRLALLPILYSEWYFPPFMALFALEAASGLAFLERIIKAPRAVLWLSLGFGLLYAMPIPATLVIERRIEHEIEDPVRRQIGLFLRDNVKPGESVSCEPAGYIGYYSGVLLYEWPGLTSPTVRQALLTVPREDRTLDTTIALLHPVWIVLRPKELADLLREQPAVAARYHLVKTFAVEPDPERLVWGGLGRDNFDGRYHVLVRTDRH